MDLKKKLIRILSFSGLKRLSCMRFRRAKASAPPCFVATLPPPPRDILANREQYEDIIYPRKYPDPKTDTPLACLYRLYEWIMLDANLEIRNHLEYFWFKRWPVCEIPDPEDAHPERYAVLASITAILVEAFNHRIKLGLPRHAPSRFTYDQLEEWRRQTPKLESEPSWAQEVPVLREQLNIPHWDQDQRDFVPLLSFDSEKASPQFKWKNILIWQPHIYFI